MRFRNGTEIAAINVTASMVMILCGNFLLSVKTLSAAIGDAVSDDEIVYSLDFTTTMFQSMALTIWSFVRQLALRLCLMVRKA